jgi:hypothetical protein
MYERQAVRSLDVDSVRPPLAHEPPPPPGGAKHREPVLAFGAKAGEQRGFLPPVHKVPDLPKCDATRVTSGAVEADNEVVGLSLRAATLEQADDLSDA